MTDSNGDVHNFVYEGDPKERLDRFLATNLEGYSRTRIKNLIMDGNVLVNEINIKKGSHQLEVGDRIQLDIPPVKSVDLVPENIPLDVIFENEDILVVNKPSGMVVHPSYGHETGTLVNAALGHAPDMEGIGGEMRPGVVHRLDKDTSGVILLAKNDRTLQHLQEQFRERTTRKVYLALVDGRPATPEGRIEAAIGRNKNNRKQMAVVPLQKGRASVTEYRTLEEFRLHTLLECRPETGRTHQIRVHLAFIHYPIVGDTIYGRKKPSLRTKRHFLHASKITITLPGDKNPSTFEAPLPSNLENMMEQMRRLES